MNDLQFKDTSGNDVTGNNDASHEGVKMETTVSQTVNDTESVEVSGIQKPTYESVYKKVAGISRTNNPIKLRDLRNDAESVIKHLVSSKEQLEASTETVEDPLDKLAQKFEIKDLVTQIENMDGIKDKINARVEELLNPSKKDEKKQK